MRKIIQIRRLLLLLIPFVAGACATTTVVGTWKDPNYSRMLRKVVVLSVAREGYLRRQFENVLTEALKARGVEAIPGYQVLPESEQPPDRDVIHAKVRELGADSVLIALPVDRKEVRNSQYSGTFFAPSAAYVDGWYNYYAGSVVYSKREYRTDYYTIATKVFDVTSNQPVWGFLSEVKVEGSREKAINQFIPTIISQLDREEMLP